MHRWVHNAASYVCNDPLFRDFEKTPSSSLFFAWHGLIRAGAAKAQQDMTLRRKAEWKQLLSAAELQKRCWWPGQEPTRGGQRLQTTSGRVFAEMASTTSGPLR